MSSARDGANGITGQFLFHELKKQASSFLRDKLRTARLALTDVTPAQLLTEEATNGNNSSPSDARTLGFISRAAFDLNDYCRIVEVLHKRLSKFDKKLWREPYKALILLEYLLTHGPEAVAEEFRRDREVIREMGTLQSIDEKGFNWGLTVKKKSERILELLENASLLKEERERARKVTPEIQGFGSFNLSFSSKSGDTNQKPLSYYARSNSQYESCSTLEDDESDDEKEQLNCNMSANWKTEFKDSREMSCDNGSKIDESEPFLLHEEEPKMNLSGKSLNCNTQMNKKSDDRQENLTCTVSAKWKAEFRDSEGISCNKGLEMDESEPFLPHKDEPKIDVSEKSLNCNLQMNKKSEFRVWPHKDIIFPANEVAMDEPEPVLPRGEEKSINEIEKLDHPFNFEHQGRESLLLLSQG